MNRSTLLYAADLLAEAHHVCGVILNVFLIYVIRRFSKASMGTYKNLLQIFAAFDIFLSIIQALAKPKVIAFGTTFACVTDTSLGSRALTTFYCACFTIPFALLNIHFLYRYWSIRSPELIVRFSNKKFIVAIALCPIGEFIVWYLLVYYGINGGADEQATIAISKEFERKYGKLIRDGWIVMDYWDDGLNISIFCALMAFDSIMGLSFCIAISLGALTFYHIKRADSLSTQFHSLQWKLFIAVCAQTIVPTLFVYIPYFCFINFPFFDLPLYFLDDFGTWLTACFPAWDALIIILLVRDYRQGVVSMITRKKTTVTWMTVSTVVVSEVHNL